MWTPAVTATPPSANVQHTSVPVVVNGVVPSSAAIAAAAADSASAWTRLSPRTNRYGIHLLNFSHESRSGSTMNSSSCDNGILGQQPDQPGLHKELTGDDAGGLLVEPRGLGRVAGLEALQIVLTEGPHQVAGAAQCGALGGVVCDAVIPRHRMECPSVGEDRDLWDAGSAVCSMKSGLTNPSETCGRSDHLPWLRALQRDGGGGAVGAWFLDDRGAHQFESFDKRGIKLTFKEGFVARRRRRWSLLSDASSPSVQIRRRIRLDIEDVVKEFERSSAGDLVHLVGWRERQQTPVAREPVFVPTEAFPDDLSGGGEHRPNLGVVGELGKVTGAARHGVVDQQSAPVGCAQCIADGGDSEMFG